MADLTLVRATAEELIARHAPEYHFSWSTHKTILGRCTYHTRTIEISRTLAVVNDMSEMRDTILHEIAHAVAGAGAGHGPAWKKVARELGARPRATAASAKTVRDTAPWVGTCPSCNVVIVRMFRAPRVNRSCNRCNTTGQYDVRHKLVFTYKP